MESTGLNNKRLPRNVKEAAGELADHYIYAHNQTEPFFLQKIFMSNKTLHVINFYYIIEILRNEVNNKIENKAEY